MQIEFKWTNKMSEQSVKWNGKTYMKRNETKFEQLCYEAAEFSKQN